MVKTVGYRVTCFMSQLLETLSYSLIKNNKRILAAVVLTGFLGIFTLVMGSQTISFYQRAVKISEENDMMKQVIEEWRDAVSFIDQQKYRPVPKDKVPSVTSDILFELQSFNLKLLDFKDSSSSDSKKNKNYKAFTLKFEGPYDQTVKFFCNFHARDALVNIRQLKITPKDNSELETEIIYRVYTK